MFEVGTNRVDVSVYSSGLYMLKLVGDDRAKRSFKIIKQ